LTVSEIRGRTLIAGEAEGSLFKLAAPISFWGGVDPASGRVADPRHPDHGRIITGQVLAISTMVGSSSSSAIMLELLRNSTAPAALILGAVDAILPLGVIVAREMGHPTIPVVEISPRELANLPERGYVRVRKDGGIEVRSKK
jgi:predicted aconitase with swiveling domain